MILNMVGGGTQGTTFPVFTYTGTYQLIDDGKEGDTQNWRIKFLTSGTLTFTEKTTAIDVFLLGGGGGGGHMLGGGGGYTSTSLVSTPSKNEPYAITIGAGGGTWANGGNTSAFGLSVQGGRGCTDGRGGNGGSGGAGRGNSLAGGIDGNNGSGGSAGTGQHSTTREFGEANGKLYATGGSTANSYTAGRSADSNTGDGGWGAGSVSSGAAPSSGSGGSGIVVIRNHREVVA